MPIVAMLRLAGGTFPVLTQQWKKFIKISEKLEGAINDLQKYIQQAKANIMMDELAKILHRIQLALVTQPDESDINQLHPARFAVIIGAIRLDGSFSTRSQANSLMWRMMYGIRVCLIHEIRLQSQGLSTFSWFENPDVSSHSALPVDITTAAESQLEQANRQNQECIDEDQSDDEEIGIYGDFVNQQAFNTPAESNIDTRLGEEILGDAPYLDEKLWYCIYFPRIVYLY